MFRSQLLAIFRELTISLTYVTYASSYVVEILHVWLEVMDMSKTCKLPEGGHELRPNTVGEIIAK